MSAQLTPALLSLPIRVACCFSTELTEKRTFVGGVRWAPGHLYGSAGRLRRGAAFIEEGGVSAGQEPIGGADLPTSHWASHWCSCCWAEPFPEGRVFLLGSVRAGCFLMGSADWAMCAGLGAMEMGVCSRGGLCC